MTKLNQQQKEDLRFIMGKAKSPMEGAKAFIKKWKLEATPGAIYQQYTYWKRNSKKTKPKKKNTPRLFPGYALMETVLGGGITISPSTKIVITATELVITF